MGPIHLVGVPLLLFRDLPARIRPILEMATVNWFHMATFSCSEPPGVYSPRSHQRPSACDMRIHHDFFARADLCALVFSTMIIWNVFIPQPGLPVGFLQ